MGLALLVWVGGSLSDKAGFILFGNEPSLGRKSPILHLTSTGVSGEHSQTYHMHDYYSL